MRQPSKTLGLSLTLLCALALGAYYFYFMQTAIAPKNNLGLLLSHPIETYIEQGEFVRFDDNGLKKEQLFLHTAYHLKEHTVTHITKPKLIQHKQDKVIELSAKQAQAIHLGSNGKIQKIIFSQDVHVTSAPFLLSTSSLTYHPETELAKTDELIDISSENLHIQAKGMTIHLHSGKMELLNQVTSKYEYDSI